jgi:hypothetical protein
VIVGARSRGADRRREGQRAVGATRGVPTGATNSAIAALLKSRYDRARPCSADFDDRSDGRVSASHVFTSFTSEVPSSSRSPNRSTAKGSDEICGCDWPLASMNVVVASGYPPPCEGVVGDGTLQPRSTSSVVVVASAVSGAARSIGPRLR